ncbi:MAG: carbamoyltransferase C-terminal domain-containing protein, partial [Candidatus Hydrogenedentota bacterium]
VRGEPIVRTPEEAYTCFMRTQMDNLVLGACVLKKEDQKPWEDDHEEWMVEFELD